MQEMRFRGTLLNGARLREAISNGEPQGEADILLAVFGTPDSNIPAGVPRRQIIDRGAFRSWIDSSGGNPKVPFYLDHGGAMAWGFADSRMIIGYADAFGEVDAGLRMTGHYNLETQIGREAYSNLIFLQDIMDFSFRWDQDKVRSDPDGWDHVVGFRTILEATQCGIGAQEDTRVLSLRTPEGLATMNELREDMDLPPATEETVEEFIEAAEEVHARGATGRHSTDTSDAPWSAGTAKKNLKADDGASYKRASAYVEDGADPKAKGSYKFWHHFVSSDGSVGAASTRACSNGIGVLNGGRGGTKIPDSARRGVYAHLAGHLKDSGMTDIAKLRTALPDLEELQAYLEEDPAFRSEMIELLGKDLPDPKTPEGAPAPIAAADELEDGASYRVTVGDEGMTFEKLEEQTAEVMARSVSLDDVAGDIRDAWYEAGAKMTMDEGYPSYDSCPLEVYVDDGTLATGYVIVYYMGGDTLKVNWSASDPDNDGDMYGDEDDDGDGIVFDIANATVVEQEWVDENGQAIRSFFSSTTLLRMLKNHEGLRNTLRTTVEEAALADPIALFYGRSLPPAPVVNEPADAES